MFAEIQKIENAARLSLGNFHDVAPAARSDSFFARGLTMMLGIVVLALPVTAALLYL